MKLPFLKILEFFKYEHGYKKALFLFTPLILGLLMVGIFVMMPLANASSIQAGITLTAEVLGALLGATLIVVVLLVEQMQNAEDNFRKVHKKYRKLIETNSELLYASIKEFEDSLDKEIIELNQSILAPKDRVPLKTKYRDIFGNLIGLLIAIEPKQLDNCEKKLKKLGFSEEEIGQYLYAGGLVAQNESSEFLSLLKEAYTPIVFWFDERINSFCGKIFESLIQDGVEEALAKHHRATRVLRSKILTGNIMILSLTTVIAVIVLFGVTDQIITLPLFRWIILFIELGFTLSVSLTLILIEKLF